MAFSASGLGEVSDSGCAPVFPSKAWTPPQGDPIPLPHRGTPDGGLCVVRPRERVACPLPAFLKAFLGSFGRLSRARTGPSLSLPVSDLLGSWYPFVSLRLCDCVSLALGESLPLFPMETLHLSGYLFVGLRISFSVSPFLPPPVALQSHLPSCSLPPSLAGLAVSTDRQHRDLHQ